MSAPEVTAARGQLDSLPAAWPSPELEASVLRRANVAAASRLLAESAAETRARIATLRQAVVDGEWGHDGLRELVAAESDVEVVLRARANLPEQSLDQAAVDAAMAKAAQAMAQAAADIRVPRLFLDEDRAAWRKESQYARVPLEPPVVTALDLAAMDAVKAVETPLGGWFAAAQTWTDLRLAGNAEPLDLLCSAASYLAQAETLTPQATNAREAVEKANAARLAAGRWTVQSAAAAALR